MGTTSGLYLRMGLRQPSGAATPPSVINILRKVSCALQASFHMWREEKAQGLLCSTVGELISPLLSSAWPLPPPNVEEQAVVGGSRGLPLLLAFLKLEKTMPYILKEKRMGEII